MRASPMRLALEAIALAAVVPFVVGVVALDLSWSLLSGADRARSRTRSRMSPSSSGSDEDFWTVVGAPLRRVGGA